MKTNLIDNRQIRVFISSTFQDMQGERDYLMKHTFPVLRKRAAERDVTLTELDLRWGITEEEAKTGKVVEICLREIENSIPFFIGIIGNRYGWVPEKKDINENVTDRFKDVDDYLERHLSVTEMEMQFGVLQREEDMHAYFYIKEGEEKETSDNPEMLERLKEEVEASRYPSSTYSSPENLAQQVEEAFTTLLDKLFPEGHLSELDKERTGQRSFMRQLCQNYIRDDKNFQALNEWMNDWDKHQLVVTGASGLGKSALIANWLKERLSDENLGYNIIYHFTGNGGSESSHEHITKTLIDEINDVYGWDTGDEKNKLHKDKQDDKLNDLFIKVASEGKKPLLIVLDAINQIVDTENAKLLNWLPIPPKNIKILFSTLEDDRTMEVFRNRNYPEFVLQPLDIERRKQLVTNYLHLYGKKLTISQIERITSDKQCENALVLKTLLDELINFGVYEKLDERIEYYLSQDSIEDFYQALLQGYEEDYNGYCEDFVKHVLSLIVLSRNGLSEDEILKATGIKPLFWSQFYCAFSTHLVSKEGIISFAHRYVQNAVSTRYTDNEEWVRNCRNAILSAVDDANTIRYLEEQTFQLNQLGEYQKLHDLLLDLETFSIFYEVHPYELGKYWRHLTVLGYSISEYLQFISSSQLTVSTYYSDLGHFTDELLSDFNQALKFHRRALEIRTRALGDVHPDIASSYNNIGCIYWQKGDYNKTFEYFLKAIEINDKIWSKGHPDTASIYNNIGGVYQIHFDYDNAMKYYLKALEIREKVLGKEHPDTAHSYNNIGLVYTDLGDYDKALEYHQKALEIREKALGRENLDTALSYRNIGGIYDDKGKYDKALEYYQTALKIRELLLGKEHPSTADSYTTIGIIYSYLGDYDKALDYLKQSLDIIEKIWGKDHAKTALSYNNIGVIYVDKGDYKKALEYYQKALEIRENVLGMEHPDTADSCTNIGIIYSYLNDYEKALEYLKQALGTRERVLGKDHLDTAASYNNIGSVLYDLGNYDKALEYYRQALSTRVSVLGKDHPDTASSYKNIGSVLYELGDYDKALEYHKQALGIREKVLGKEHPHTALSYNITGILFYKRGEYKNAFEWFYKAANLGVADAQYNLGHMYENGYGIEQSYETAVYYYSKASEQNYAKAQNELGVKYRLGLGVNQNNEKAFELYSKAAEQGFPIAQSNLGWMYAHGCGTELNCEKAIEWFLKAAKQGFKNAYNSLAWTYHLIGHYDEALPWAKKAVAAIPNNPGIIDTLATVYQDLGRYDEALEQFELCLKLKNERGDIEESIQKTEEKIKELKKIMNV